MKPIIIAEACQNHNGSREVLKRMVHEAAENGADYVKIQSIRSAELTRRERFEEGVTGSDGTQIAIRRPFAPELERMKRLELSVDDEAWFVDECLRAGVRSMTTAFTRQVARDVRDLGFDGIKVASYDCASFPLLRELREAFSTLVVSTGATFDAEIEQAAKILRTGSFVFLHCVTIYPTPVEEFHLRRMQWLRRFAPSVGLSDHSSVAADGLSASKIALALGADCIERHFTILGADDTRDGPVSIDPKQLRDLRAFADLPRPERMEKLRHTQTNWERALGRSTRPLSAVELRNRDYYRGRFASKKDGQTIYNWEDTVL
jgi:N,N'-diacetyllegionaminate synthase